MDFGQPDWRIGGEGRIFGDMQCQGGFGDGPIDRPAGGAVGEMTTYVVGPKKAGVRLLCLSVVPAGSCGPSPLSCGYWQPQLCGRGYV